MLARPLLLFRDGAWARFLQVSLLFLLYTAIYEFIRYLVGPDSATAPLKHAHDVLRIERGLGLFIEPNLQRVMFDVPGLERLTVWAYKYEHLAGSILFLVWYFFKSPAKFTFVWRWFWIAHALAIVGFWLFPLAPPRLVPELGLIDPSAVALANTPGWALFDHIRNEYAAMPSLHVGYPLLFATVIWFEFPGTRLRWLAWLWPAGMAFVVMATANHYWLDAVGGAFVIAISAYLAQRLFGTLTTPWKAAAETGERKAARFALKEPE